LRQDRSFHHQHGCDPISEGVRDSALANDFGRRLKQAEEFAFTMRVAVEDPCPGLFDH
jgi:hypothetical protein